MMQETRKEIGGTHYAMSIEPIEFIYDLDFCRGNVIKYVCRYKKKNGIEDLEKALDYLKLCKKYFINSNKRNLEIENKKQLVIRLFLNNEIYVDQYKCIFYVLDWDLDNAENMIKKMRKNYENKENRV